MLRLLKRELFDIHIHKLLLCNRGVGQEKIFVECVGINSMLLVGDSWLSVWSAFVKSKLPSADANIGTKKIIITNMIIVIVVKERLKIFDIIWPPFEIKYFLINEAYKWYLI